MQFLLNLCLARKLIPSQETWLKRLTAVPNVFKRLMGKAFHGNKKIQKFCACCKEGSLSRRALHADFVRPATGGAWHSLDGKGNRVAADKHTHRPVHHHNNGPYDNVRPHKKEQELRKWFL